MTDLNTHITATTAHAGAAISLQGPFTFSTSRNVEQVMKDIDSSLFQEVANRISSRETITSNLNTLQSSFNNHVNASSTSAHSFGNISGQISNTQIADSSIPASKLDYTTGGSSSLDSRYVSKSGDTMGGNLTMNANIIMAPTRTVDGVDVSELDRQVQVLRGATPREVTRGSIDLRSLSTREIFVPVFGGGGSRVIVIDPYYITLSETCTAPVGHSGPVTPNIPFTLGKYFTDFTFSDSDHHPRQDLAMTTEPEMHLFHRDDRPCIEIRIKCSFSGNSYFTDAGGSNPTLQYIVYQLVTE